MDSRQRTLPLFVGGFLGPFGTLVMLPMVPELRETFDATTTAVNWGYVAYILPFSVLLVISGTIGERYGRRRVLTAAYLSFGLASLMCAAAPTLEIFILGRGLQGSANAFVTPLLIAGLAEVTPEGRLGRVVGIYGSIQAAGGALGPWLGGIAADTQWQLAFVGVAATSFALAPFAPEGGPRSEATAPPIRPLLTSRMVTIGLGAMFISAGPVGASVLIGIKARDELGISGAAAGTLLLSGSLLAMVVGPAGGYLLDRIGVRATALGAVGLASLLTATLAWASSTTLLTANWLLLGALNSLVVIAFQNIGALAVPANRAGGLSLILAWRFLGHGIGPLVFVPMWVVAPTAAFVVSAALGLFTIASLVREA